VRLTEFVNKNPESKWWEDFQNMNGWCKIHGDSILKGLSHQPCPICHHCLIDNFRERYNVRVWVLERIEEEKVFQIVRQLIPSTYSNLWYIHGPVERVILAVIFLHPPLHRPTQLRDHTHPYPPNSVYIFQFVNGL